MTYFETLDAYVRARALGHYDEAIEHLEAAIKMAPCNEAIPTLAKMLIDCRAQRPWRDGFKSLWRKVRAA